MKTKKDCMKKDYQKSPKYLKIIAKFAAQSAAKKNYDKNTILMCQVKKDYQKRL